MAIAFSRVGCPGKVGQPLGIALVHLIKMGHALAPNQTLELPRSRLTLNVYMAWPIPHDMWYLTFPALVEIRVIHVTGPDRVSIKVVEDCGERR